MASENPSSKGQAWFCTTSLPSDVVIEVDGMIFHLHKFPLMSKSRKLQELITGQEKNSDIRSTRIQNSCGKNQKNDEKETQNEEDDENEDEKCHITLPDFPGGSKSFETAAKFCYGLKINLSANNAAPLRCAGEYLEMTEEYSEDNMISKTERFLTEFVFKNVKNSVKTLKTSESLMPLAENLGIVERCIDAITSRAASSDPSLFGWPVTSRIEENVKRESTNIMDSWFDDLGLLSLPFIKRLIFSIKSSNLSPEIIETCLISYAKKYIPGISRMQRKPSSSYNVTSENEQRELLETVIANLPLEKSSISSSTTTWFLCILLRTANILNASEACRATLEEKIGLQLEEATLDDLLIPSYSYLNETLYDVDCVERIVGHFLRGLEERSRIGVEDENSSFQSAALMLVGKLIDGYLSEIASDVNLQPEKLYQLAVSLPEYARIFDDGLYRAVDVYLKAHPWTMEAEREKIFGILDCPKLTLEACTHAAQNERLPLRAVVQVLFFEQLELRHAIAGTHLASEASPIGGGEEEEMGARAAVMALEQEGSRTWKATVQENQVLKQDMDCMRTRVYQLERECSAMRKTIDMMGPPAKAERGGWRTSLTKKFGCKFKSQVCDSHEPAVAGVEGRKGLSHRHDQ
ncbi:BTB/POZ domain-containing protein [Abeliophyllum distichum]|uniref:BTB/POZ domain-containing protein n=1 Tax=Abeliophyllum distichum TaxID=126358 RepID=A0ABD1SWR0_9LAMI